jgi:hypothetical protein
MAPGTVCRDATGRSIENPDFCRMSPTRRANLPDLACHAANGSSVKF